MWNTGISDHWLPAGSYGGIYGCYSTALRSRKHEGDEEVCGIRCGTYRDRNRYSYIAEHDQYGEGAAFDEYTVRHVWRSLRIYYGHLRRDCAQALYNYLASVLRALGDSKRPLYFLVIAALLNIVLDLVFIIVFRMGAAGAAYATVIAQGISGILCLLYIAKKVPALYLHREDWEIDKNLAGWQLKIGLPMAFQYSITAIGTIVVQSCLNILGSTAAAGFAAASKIEQVFTQAYVALGTTMATYCAQNMGAGKYTRIRKGFKSATLIGFIYAVVTGVIIFFVGKYMTIFFVSENVNQIMEYVDIYLRCVSVSFLPLVIVNLYRNGIQGMGYGLLPMTAGIAELVGRSGASLIASHFGSYMGICLASPAAWVLAGTLLLIMYFEIMKGKKDRNLKNR